MIITDEIKSPCTKLCKYDYQLGYCIGCRRKLDEIIKWRHLSNYEKNRIKERIKEEHMIISFVDTETGGINFLTDALLSISILKYDMIQNKIISTYNYYIEADGTKKLDTNALAVNGYYIGKWKDDGVVTEKSKKEIAKEIEEILVSSDYIFSHNAPFDSAFIKTFLFENNIVNINLKYWFDTASIAFYIKYMNNNINGLSLNSLVKDYNINIIRQKEHSAEQDTEILKEVFINMVKQRGN